MAVIFLKPQFTKIEKNNCFRIHTRRNLNKIREETIKKFYVIKSREFLKIDLRRIFKHGNSQVYHFANNSVMAYCCFLLTRQVCSQKGLLCRSSQEVLTKMAARLLEVRSRLPVAFFLLFT